MGLPQSHTDGGISQWQWELRLWLQCFLDCILQARLQNSTLLKVLEENNMNELEKKFQNVADFYATTHKLKELVRNGWKQWRVDVTRLESVAEHIYGCQMLAFAMISEFQLDINLEKVLIMLVFHELGENVIGDYTIHDNITKEEKYKKEWQAICNILSPLKNKEYVLNLLDDFMHKRSKEALFAYYIDKFECDIQCKYYDEMGFCDMNEVRKCENLLEDLRRHDALVDNHESFSQIWIGYDKKVLPYDETFKNFCDFILSHEIFKGKKWLI